MSIMIVDGPLAKRFDAAEDAVQVCTPDGRLLGYFSPARPRTLCLDPQISAAELDRIEADGPGRPLADILRDLQAANP